MRDALSHIQENHILSSTFYPSVWLSLSLSVRIYQLGGSWTNFRKIPSWKLLYNTCREIPIPLYSKKNIGQFTWRQHVLHFSRLRVAQQYERKVIFGLPWLRERARNFSICGYFLSLIICCTTTKRKLWI